MWRSMRRLALTGAIGILGTGASDPTVETRPRDPVAVHRDATTASVVEYRVGFRTSQPRAFIVECRVPDAPPVIRLRMPVYTPGSLVQNNARWVRRLQSTDHTGQCLRTYRTGPHTWAVAGAQGATISIRYEVLPNTADEIGLTTNALTEHGGFFHPTTVLLEVVEPPNRAVDLRLLVPDGWTQAAINGPDAEGSYRAQQYRNLALNPVLVGELTTEAIALNDLRFRVIGDGAIPHYSKGKLEEYLQKIVGHHAAVFGGTPFATYTLLMRWRPDLEFGGGLARTHGMVLNIGTTWGQNLPDQAVGTIAHELIHAYNFGAAMPSSAFRVDLMQPPVMEEHWFVEGTATYYALLGLARTRVISHDAFLAWLGSAMTAHENSEGRRWISFEEYGRTEWIEPIEALNLYDGAAAVLFLLDVEIRRATDHRRSLDHVVRQLYRASRQRGYVGYTNADIQEVAAQIAGRAVGAAFASYVSETDAIDYAAILGTIGLRLDADEVKGGGVLFRVRVDPACKAVAQEYLTRLLADPSAPT